MSSIVENSIMLTYDELRILLYSQGCRACQGIYMPRKDFTAEEIIESLKKLTDCGLLTLDKAEENTQKLPVVFGDDAEESNDDEMFFIREDLLKIVKIIGDPAGVDVLNISGGKKVFCYFSEQGIVTSEKYAARVQTVKIRLFDAAEFDQWRNVNEEVAL